MRSVSKIFIYPLKSATGIDLNNSNVNSRGLQHDRRLAVIDNDNKVITAREHPELLQIRCNISDQGIELCHESSVKMVRFENSRRTLPLVVFREPATGVSLGTEADVWISDYLGVDCKLVYMNDHSFRPVLAEYGGKDGDEVSYADECPILLLSEASISDLNTRLEKPVSIDHFRPNIVIKGCSPYEEDSWSYIRIGDSEFEVAQLCKRCVFVTIHPETGEKDKNQEPLRTLAQYKKHPKGGAAFGVHLIPRKIGQIKKGDLLEVVS